MDLKGHFEATWEARGRLLTATFSDIVTRSTKETRARPELIPGAPSGPMCSVLSRVSKATIYLIRTIWRLH
jgi:hypothetical protein